MEQADPCAGLGKCDSRVASGQVLEALLILHLQKLQEFVDGLLHILLVRSGIHVFFIVLVGGLLRRRWVWNVLSSITKTCVYHDVLGYFGISNAAFKSETSNQFSVLIILSRSQKIMTHCAPNGWSACQGRQHQGPQRKV